MINYEKIQSEYLKKMLKNPAGGRSDKKMEYTWYVSPLSEDRYYSLCDGYTLYRIPEDKMCLRPDAVPPSAGPDSAIRMAEEHRHEWMQVWQTSFETKRLDKHTVARFDNSGIDGQEYVYKWIDKKFFNGIFKGCTFVTYPGAISAPVLVFDADSPDIATAKFDALLMPTVLSADGTGLPLSRQEK